MQSVHAISLRSVRILFPIYVYVFQWSLPFRFSDQSFLCTSRLSHACYMPHPSYPLDLITLTMYDEACKLWSSSICSLLQPPVTSSLLGPNLSPQPLFSNTLNLRSSYSMTEQVLHSYGLHFMSAFFILEILDTNEIQNILYVYVKIQNSVDVLNIWIKFYISTRFMMYLKSAVASVASLSPKLGSCQPGSLS